MDNIAEMIQSKNCTLIDVREPYELEIEGNIPQAKNIPMAQIPENIEDIKNMTQPIFLFCRTGGRAGNIQQFLNQYQIESQNLGGYCDVLTIIEA